MLVSFLFQYANGCCFLSGFIDSICRWRLRFVRDFDQLRFPTVGIGKTICLMQFFPKLGGERLLMIADKVICQITDGEVFEEQAFWQGTEVRFQPSDYF